MSEDNIKKDFCERSFENKTYVIVICSLLNFEHLEGREDRNCLVTIYGTKFPKFRFLLVWPWTCNFAVPLSTVLTDYLDAHFVGDCTSSSYFPAVGVQRRRQNVVTKTSQNIPITKPTWCTNISNLFLFLYEDCTCFGRFLCPSSGV